MRIAALLCSAWSPIRRIGSDKKAAAAVEFALILPIMLTLYISGVSVTEAFNINRKVIIAAHTIADLTARYDEVNDGKIKDILNAAEAVFAPYPSDKLTVTVTSVKIWPDGRAEVLWSKTKTDGKIKDGRSGNVTSEIPEALKVADTGLIWGEASYVYEPAVAYELTGKIHLSERTFLRPRIGTFVTEE